MPTELPICFMVTSSWAQREEDMAQLAWKDWPGLHHSVAPFLPDLGPELITGALKEESQRVSHLEAIQTQLHLNCKTHLQELPLPVESHLSSWAWVVEHTQSILGCHIGLASRPL